MKFACPKCNTRYTISDDKVPPSAALRFSCKKCGNVIRVKRKEGAVSDDDDAPKPAAKPAAKPAEKKAASKEFRDSTKIASLAEINALKVESAKKAAAAAAAAASQAPDEWFVLIGGQQKGPLKAAELKAMLGKKEIDKRTYIWRDGMEDWQRIGLVADFADAASEAGDAAWRVVKPIANKPSAKAADEGLGDNATRMMNAKQLQEELAKTKQAAQPNPNATVAMNAKQLQEELKKTREAGRSESKRGTGEFSNATVAMDARQLQEELKKTRAAEQGKGFSAPTGAQATVTMDARQLQEELRKTREAAGKRPLDPPEDPEPEPEPVDDDETVAAAALAGEPTGDAMMREVSDDELIEDAPFAEDLDDERRGPTPFERESSDPFVLPRESSVVGIPGSNEAYMNAPPGEATRVFMTTAGIYRRRRNNKIAAVAAGCFVALIIGLAALDITGIYTLPLMGGFYDITGIKDPNLDRAVARVESKLSDSSLSLEERDKLRQKLLGLETDAVKSGKKVVKKEPGEKEPPTKEQQGIEEKKNVNADEHSLAANIFADDRKKESGIKLVDPGEIQTPNLPEGLTQEAIFKVINDNTRAMGLCIAESAKKGEKAPGKMEVSMTIAPVGNVSEVEITAPPRFGMSVLGGCTIRRVKGWKFPRFNGDPVTVVFPYVMSTGF